MRLAEALWTTRADLPAYSPGVVTEQFRDPSRSSLGVWGGQDMSRVWVLSSAKWEVSWEGETGRAWELEADLRVHADVHPCTTDAEDSYT